MEFDRQVGIRDLSCLWK